MHIVTSVCVCVCARVSAEECQPNTREVKTYINASQYFLLCMLNPERRKQLCTGATPNATFGPSRFQGPPPRLSLLSGAQGPQSARNRKQTSPSHWTHFLWQREGEGVGLVAPWPPVAACSLSKTPFVFLKRGREEGLLRFLFPHEG